MTATHIPPDDPATRALLRHVLATLAYRAGKTVRGTPEAFADFMVAPGSNTPRALLAHMGDLMDWSLRMARDGERKWTSATPLPWGQEQERFFAAVGALDAHLASSAPLKWDPGELFQGGMADALTHSGQLAMLRRLSGHKMKGENYSRADIVSGRTGLEQTAPDPKNEFD
jgi:hypothetical protein